MLPWEVPHKRAQLRLRLDNVLNQLVAALKRHSRDSPFAGFRRPKIISSCAP